MFKRKTVSLLNATPRIMFVNIVIIANFKTFM